MFKNGMTRRLEPLDRVRELGDASVPFSFDVHSMIYSDDAPELENALHKKFSDLRVNKVNSRKEFFRVPLSSIRDEVANLPENIAKNVKWTIKAEAHEYWESVAANQPMRHNDEGFE